MNITARIKYSLLERRRRHLLSRAPNGAMRDFLATPLPGLDKKALESEFLALDFETTGLDPGKDRILSIGHVLVRGGRIVLGESGHHVVNVGVLLSGESVAIHHITDMEARAGRHFREVMDHLLKQMSGRILLVHFAPIERGFLRAASRALYGVEPPLPMVDTMALEQKRLTRFTPHIKPGELRLANLRRHYGLPPHKAHNALEDAIATAELFLAIINRRFDGMDKASTARLLT